MVKRKKDVKDIAIIGKRTSPNYRCDFREARRVDSKGKKYTVEECVDKFARIAVYYSIKSGDDVNNRDAFLRAILDFNLKGVC